LRLLLRVAVLRLLILWLLRIAVLRRRLLVLARVGTAACIGLRIRLLRPANGRHKNHCAQRKMPNRPIRPS